MPPAHACHACRAFVGKSFARDLEACRYTFFSKDLPQDKLERCAAPRCAVLWSAVVWCSIVLWCVVAWLDAHGACH